MQINVNVQDTKLSNAELEIRLLESRNAEKHARTCIKNLTNDKEELHKKIKEMKKDMQNYKTEIENVRKEMAQVMKRINLLNETIKELNQTIVAYETLLKTKDTKIEQERQEHREFVESQKQIESERKGTWDDMKTVVTACMEKMEIENKRLQTAKEKAETEKKELINTNVKELQNEIRGSIPKKEKDCNIS